TITLSLHDALPIFCSRIWFSLIAQLATDGPDSFRNSVFSTPNGAAPASRERSSDFVTTLCTFVHAFCSERQEFAKNGEKRATTAPLVFWKAKARARLAEPAARQALGAWVRCVPQAPRPGR